MSTLAHRSVEQHYDLVPLNSNWPPATLGIDALGRIIGTVTALRRERNLNVFAASGVSSAIPKRVLMPLKESAGFAQRMRHPSDPKRICLSRSKVCAAHQKDAWAEALKPSSIGCATLYLKK